MQPHPNLAPALAHHVGMARPVALLNMWLMRSAGVRRWLWSPTSLRRQYAIAFALPAAVTVINLWLRNSIGYQTIALIYLLAIVPPACLFNRGPIILCTSLAVGAWNYLFAPPVYSFNVADSYDQMMVATFFVVALTVGHLTARLRAQQAAEVQAKLLVESERLGRALLNSVSHEFRTPIAAIASAASSLRVQPLAAHQLNLIGEIESAGARLDRVVQSLLNAARLQSGQLRPRLDWCDVSELVRVTLRNLDSLLAPHPIKSFLPAGLPLVKADFVLMEQALANLLVNAATHTPPETPIEIRAHTDAAGKIFLQIADRGPGLPVDQLERIFEPFHRATTQSPGTGLGLAIVKGFVEAQGGDVTASNRDGGGAVFTICLHATHRPQLPEESL